MLHLCLTFDSFGGRDKVVDFLFENGLLSRVCPGCHQEKPLLREKGRTIPRFHCGTCKRKVCCTENSVFEWQKIRNIPLFLFVAHCFTLRVPTKSIQALSGADYRTVRRYITALRDALCASVKKMHVTGELKLGGEGKVVEVDEMMVCHRKYFVGRRVVKEGTWILGLTEVDSAKHPIENPEALQKLREREQKREQAVLERAERRKVAKQRQIQSRLNTFPSAFTHGRPIQTIQAPGTADLPDCREDAMPNEQTDDDEEVDDPVDLVHVGEDCDDSGDALARVAFENQMKSLFSQSRK